MRWDPVFKLKYGGAKSAATAESNGTSDRSFRLTKNGDLCGRRSEVTLQSVATHLAAQTVAVAGAGQGRGCHFMT